MILVFCHRWRQGQKPKGDFRSKIVLVPLSEFHAESGYAFCFRVARRLHAFAEKNTALPCRNQKILVVLAKVTQNCFRRCLHHCWPCTCSVHRLCCSVHHFYKVKSWALSDVVSVFLRVICRRYLLRSWLSHDAEWLIDSASLIETIPENNHKEGTVTTWAGKPVWLNFFPNANNYSPAPSTMSHLVRPLVTCRVRWSLAPKNKYKVLLLMSFCSTRTSMNSMACASDQSV